MPAPFGVVVSQDHDHSAGQVMLTPWGQAISGPTEREGGAAALRDGVHVFLALGPEQQGIRDERIVTGEVWDGTETFRFSILPATLAVVIRHTKHVEGIIIRDDLDANRNAPLAVDVPPLLTVTHARPFIARGDEPRLAFVVGRRTGGEGLRRGGRRLGRGGDRR